MTDEQIDAMAKAQPNKCVTAYLTRKQFRDFARDVIRASSRAAAPTPAQSGEPSAAVEADRPAWRAHETAITAKAHATAQEIALMWGDGRAQFVQRIQFAVIDAMKWLDYSTPSAVVVDDERAAFEAWASQKGWPISAGAVCYTNPTTEKMWDAWQACAALAQPSGAGNKR